jgi:hypothetical protein
MDTEKISKFIATARTKTGFTQKELADKIGVSDKTISKWETGKSLPDISYYEALCDALNIKVNELLSGEYLTEDVYLEKAETNFVDIIRENDISRKKIFAKLFAGLALFIFALILIAVMSKISLSNIVMGFLDAPTFIIFLFINLGAIIISGRRTLDDILTLLRRISIPTGVLLTFVSFSLFPMNITSINLFWGCIMVSLISSVYGLVEYLIVIILSRNLK